MIVDHEGAPRIGSWVLVRTRWRSLCSILRCATWGLVVASFGFVGMAIAQAQAGRLSPYPPPEEWGQPISVELENASVQVAVQTVADLVGLSVVVPGEVRGVVSLQLKDVSWPHALQAIGLAANVDIFQKNGVYWVASSALGRPQSEGQSSAQQDRVAQNEPIPRLESRVFKLNHAEAPELLRQLQSAIQPVTSRSRAAVGVASDAVSGVVVGAIAHMWADARSNQLFVADEASRLELIAQWVAALDVPLRQVVIEAKIVEADQNFSRQLGVRLGTGRAAPLAWGEHVGIGPSYESVSSAQLGPMLPFVNLPATGVNGYPAATFAVSLFGAGVSRFLNLEISALEADGKGKVVSSPHVVTTDRVKALIQQGTEYPYQTTNSNGQVSVEFRKASLKLEVTPRIAPNGYVMLDLVVHKDSRGETTASGIAINTKQVQTQVLVEDGGTLVIGGILEEYVRDELTRVPVLGEIPWIGNVFKSTSKRTDKTEIVVFITPRVIENH